jgi:uncharacterized glyoxalase superfamily protein PhnB
MNNPMYFELQADEPQRLITFYQSVFGWEFQKQTATPTKKGVRIDKAKYDFIHAEIIKALRDMGAVSAMGLVRELDERVGDIKFGGSIGWYTTAVRLDMEAKKEILYDRHDKKPQIKMP